MRQRPHQKYVISPVNMIAGIKKSLPAVLTFLWNSYILRGLIKCVFSTHTKLHWNVFPEGLDSNQPFALRSVGFFVMAQICTLQLLKPFNFFYCHVVESVYDVGSWIELWPIRVRLFTLVCSVTLMELLVYNNVWCSSIVKWFEG